MYIYTYIYTYISKVNIIYSFIHALNSNLTFIKYGYNNNT